MNYRSVSEIVDARSVLDAMPDRTVVVGAGGEIIASNHAWDGFSSHIGGASAARGVGVNYLDVCQQSFQSGCSDAGAAADCVSRVLSGAVERCFLEYDCTTPQRVRWFMMRVSALQGSGRLQAMVSHLEITTRKIAEYSAVWAFDLLIEGRVTSLAALGVRVFNCLSDREQEVAGLLLRGDRVSAIAARQFVSPSTVRSQLSSVYAKLGVASQQELIELVRTELVAARS